MERKCLRVRFRKPYFSQEMTMEQSLQPCIMLNVCRYLVDMFTYVRYVKKKYRKYQNVHKPLP